MSAAQTALEGLVGALSAAAPPGSVALAPAAPPSGGAPDPADDGSASAVRVRAVSLTRVGRSNRSGPILDLELCARVQVTGPEALATAESLLIALERDGGRQVEPLPAGAGAAGQGLGFDVRVRVPVRLDLPVGPPVREPMRLDVRPARAMAGVVLDADGAGVPDAVVRVADGGRAVVADASGRFRILVAQAAGQEFVVEVRGTTRTLEAATQTAPVVIRWE